MPFNTGRYPERKREQGRLEGGLRRGKGGGGQTRIWQPCFNTQERRKVDRQRKKNEIKNPTIATTTTTSLTLSTSLQALKVIIQKKNLWRTLAAVYSTITELPILYVPRGGEDRKLDERTRVKNMNGTPGKIFYPSQFTHENL